MSPAVRTFLLLPALFSAADYYMEASRDAQPRHADFLCTLIGVVRGVDLRIDEAFAQTIRAGTVVACWKGTCRTVPLELMSYGQSGMAEIPDLPAEPVNLAIHFTDVAGAPLPARTITIVPKMVYANGPNCGADGPHASLRVDASGHLLIAR